MNITKFKRLVNNFRGKYPRKKNWFACDIIESLKIYKLNCVSLTYYLTYKRNHYSKAISVVDFYYQD